MGIESSLKLRKRRMMRRKDAKKLMEEAVNFFDGILPKTVEQAELNGTKVYLIDGVIKLARVDSFLFPTLKCPSLETLPSVVVDMGAIPYVCNGADIMAPGIVDVKGNFKKNSLVVIKDMQYSKALALGIVLASSKELRKAVQGKMVKNLHYVGDKLWGILPH